MRWNGLKLAYSRRDDTGEPLKDQSRLPEDARKPWSMKADRPSLIGRGQHIADDPAIVRLVLDHQNALAHAVTTCCPTFIGSVKVNVDPWPTIESTQMGECGSSVSAST